MLTPRLSTVQHQAEDCKLVTQDCHTRSLVYETSCHTCQTRDEERVRGRWTGDEKGLKEELRKVSRYVYIGETARSSYERGWEHINDIDS